MKLTEYDDKLVITANDENGIIVDGPGARIGEGIDNAMEKALVEYNSL